MRSNRTLRGLLIVAAVGLSARDANANYSPMSFLELVGCADRIVVGTIAVVEEGTVDVKIDEVVVGAGNAGEIVRVERFRDWACAWRWAPYKVDQRVLLFLVRDEEDPTRLRILGAGDEGESLVRAEQVELNFHIASPNVERQGAAKNVAPLAPLCAAIADCRAAYRFTRSEGRPILLDGPEPGFVRFSRIERVSTEPAKPGFQKRYPPGAPHRPTAFETRSPYHKILAHELEIELRRIKRQADGE